LVRGIGHVNYVSVLIRRTYLVEGEVNDRPREGPAAQVWATVLVWPVTITWLRLFTSCIALCMS